MPRQKRRGKKLILRKDLLYKTKHQTSETSRVDLKNSNLNSGIKENSNDKNNLKKSLDEDKNIDIFQNNDIQIFSKPVL